MKIAQQDLLVGGISSVLGDLAGGQFNLGSALNAFNTFKNAKSLSKEGLRQEGFNILKRQLGTIGKEGVGGLSNITIPKISGNGGANSVTRTTGGSVNTNSSLYQSRINQAAGIDGPADASTLQSQRNGGT